ncbi:MAG: hypothetical protein V4597_11540 [Pseudomonadota bacterium]
MAFPATQSPLDRALLDVQTAARALKQQATDARAAMLAGPVSANLVTQIFEQCRLAKVAFTTAAAVPNLGTYAQTQFANAGLDIVAEFNTMSAAVDGVTSWVTANFPASGGYVLKDTISAVSGLQARAFTTSDTAGLQTALATLIAAIN